MPATRQQSWYDTGMTTNPADIKHLWTHKTQDHTWLPDEDLVIDRAEGVWVWTEKGTKLLDGFAGLAVVNVGHGRREIAEAIAEQTVRLAYYPTTRQFSNRPAAELAAKLATLTPGDLDYTMFAVSGSEANERADADGPALLAGQGQGRQAQGDLAGGRLSRRHHGDVRHLRAAAHDRRLRAAAAGRLRQGEAALPVPRPGHRHRRRAGRAARARAAPGHREGRARHGLGRHHGARDLVRRLHHAAHRLAARRCGRSATISRSC